MVRTFKKGDDITKYVTILSRGNGIYALRTGREVVIDEEAKVLYYVSCSDDWFVTQASVIGEGEDNTNDLWKNWIVNHLLTYVAVSDFKWI